MGLKIFESLIKVESNGKLHPSILLGERLAADWVETAQVGCIHIRGYESELLRAGRLGTLREKKRKLDTNV